MARPKRINLTLDEQLEKIDKEIEATETSLKELKITRKELETKIKMDKLEEIESIITASGKSIDEVKELLLK